MHPIRCTVRSSLARCMIDACYLFAAAAGGQHAQLSFAAHTGTITRDGCCGQLINEQENKS